MQEAFYVYSIIEPTYYILTKYTTIEICYTYTSAYDYLLATIILYKKEVKKYSRLCVAYQKL